MGSGKEKQKTALSLNIIIMPMQFIYNMMLYFTINKLRLGKNI